MTKKRWTATAPRSAALATALIGFLAGSSAALAAATVLGQISSDNVLVDGVRVPSGTTLLTDSLLKTRTTPAVVHLDNGGLLRVESNSSAHFAGSTAGDVGVDVRSGTISFRDAGGEAFAIAESSLVVFDPDGQVREGARVDDRVRLCALQDPWNETQCKANPQDSICNWTLVIVAPTDVQTHLDQGAVYAGANNLGLDDDCEADPLAMPEDDKDRGPGTWVWVAVGVGGAGAVYILADELDDEGSASPFQP